MSEKLFFRGKNVETLLPRVLRVFAQHGLEVKESFMQAEPGDHDCQPVPKSLLSAVLLRCTVMPCSYTCIHSFLLVHATT